MVSLPPKYLPYIHTPIQSQRHIIIIYNHPLHTLSTLSTHLPPRPRPPKIHIRPPAPLPLPIRPHLIPIRIANHNPPTPIILLTIPTRIRVLHIPNIRTLPIALIGKMPTPHIRRRKRLMRVVDLPIVIDGIRALLEGLGGVGVGAEEARGVVSDPAVEDEEPPVALVEEPLDLDVVLGAADGGEGREGYAGVDGGVDLDPAGYVAVPTALVVGGGGVAVGGVVDEEVGGGDLVGVVDPVAAVRWWVVGLGAGGRTILLLRFACIPGLGRCTRGS